MSPRRQKAYFIGGIASNKVMQKFIYSFDVATKTFKRLSGKLTYKALIIQFSMYYVLLNGLCINLYLYLYINLHQSIYIHI